MSKDDMEYVAPSTANESGRGSLPAPSPRGITREQFVRGIDAINRYQRMRDAVGVAMRAGGCDVPDDIGGGDLSEELKRQLSERCNDHGDQYGALIDYMLYDCGGPITLPDGRRFMVNTPELLWIYWQSTGSGPFDDGVEQRGSTSTLAPDAERRIPTNNLPERAKP